jgi:predicted AAA+ superfamily ATPase
MFNRSIDLKALDSSFFLWGPRQTGKSYWLKHQFPQALWVNLLRSDEFVKYTQDPSALRAETKSLEANSWIVIDEVQKVPALLDEVHELIESRAFRFALCGSSARKLKRGKANLLGGRAFRRQLWGLSSTELGSDFKLKRALNIGSLPKAWTLADPSELLRSYALDYLREEVSAEALVKRLDSFSQFLSLAALSDTQALSYSTIARDIGVSQPTVRSYFEILEDTLIGHFLPAFRLKPKRRIELTPKFYFFDVGVVNFLAKRSPIETGSELFGKAFENWIHHELRCFQSYKSPDLDLSYWKSGLLEVDFVLGKAQAAIEVKASSRIQSDHLRGLRAFGQDYPDCKSRVVVCTESKIRQTDDGIWILPFEAFIDRLYSGELLG